MVLQLLILGSALGGTIVGANDEKQSQLKLRVGLTLLGEELERLIPQGLVHREGIGESDLDLFND